MHRKTSYTPTSTPAEGQTKRPAVLKLPTSSNFGAIIRNNERYIDKTAMIETLLDDAAYVKVIQRPKSSGKSLTLSMLQHFFSPLVEGKETKNLFDGLKVAGHHKQGQFTVLMLDFSCINIASCKSFTDFYTEFCTIVIKLYQQHAYLLESDIGSYYKDNFMRIMALEKLSADERLQQEGDVSYAVLELAKMIKAYNTLKRLPHRKINPMILIDACVIPKHTLSPLEHKIQYFFKSFYDATFKNTDDDIASAVILSEEDGNLFSDNCREFSLAHDRIYTTCIGLTGKEVIVLFEEAHLEIELSLDAITKIFFSVADTNLVCPSSIISSIRSQQYARFMQAAERGELAFVEQYIAENIHIPHVFNNVDRYNHSALMLAAQSGHVAIIRALLRVPNVNVHCRNLYGYNALMLAATYGYAAVVDALLSVSDINAVNQDRETALMLAAKRGHIRVVKLLLARTTHVDAINNTGKTALHLAAANDHFDVACALVERGAGLNTPDENNVTPLHLAAVNGHISVVNALLTRKAIVDAINIKGETPLYLAVFCGHMNIVKMLLLSHADINAADKRGRTPLMRLAADGYYMRLPAFLAFPGIKMSATDHLGNTALMLAADENNSTIIQILLPFLNIREINAVNMAGCTALMLAALKNHARTVEILLTISRINIRAVDQHCRTAAMLTKDNKIAKLINAKIVSAEQFLAAARDDNLAIVERYTTYYEFNSFAPDSAAVAALNTSFIATGDTALHLAAKKGHRNIVDHLRMTNGVNIRITNLLGHTPAREAELHGHIEIAVLLGALLNAQEPASLSSSSPAVVAAESPASSGQLTFQNRLDLINFEEEGGEIPDEFYNKISHGIINDPIHVANGQIYDRASLRNWYESSACIKDTKLKTFPDPLRGSNIHENELDKETDTETRDLIEAFVLAKEQDHAEKEREKKRNKELAAAQPATSPASCTMSFFCGDDFIGRLYDRSDEIRKETVAALASYGLTDDLLETYQPVKGDPRASFSDWQRDVLIYLVTGAPLKHNPLSDPMQRPLLVDQRCTPEQAIAEINGLNLHQLDVLKECYAYGLRGSHLRQLECDFFGLWHRRALTVLIQYRDLAPASALHLIERTTEDEAWKIYRERPHDEENSGSTMLSRKKY